MVIIFWVRYHLFVGTRIVGKLQKLQMLRLCYTSEGSCTIIIEKDHLEVLIASFGLDLGCVMSDIGFGFQSSFRSGSYHVGILVNLDDAYSLFRFKST